MCKFPSIIFFSLSFSFVCFFFSRVSQIEMEKIEMENLGVEYVGNFVTYTIFCVKFYDDEIETTVTSETVAVDDWISTIHGGIVSLSAKYCRASSYPVIIQICCGKKCLIFQIHRQGTIPPSLQGLINNPNNIIVGVTIKSILEQLKGIYGLVLSDDFASVDIRDFLADQGDVVRKWRIQQISTNILQKGYRTPKQINKRWTKNVLGNRKILFATVDAYATFLAASRLIVEGL